MMGVLRPKPKELKRLLRSPLRQPGESKVTVHASEEGYIRSPSRSSPSSSFTLHTSSYSKVQNKHDMDLFLFPKHSKIYAMACCLSKPKSLLICRMSWPWFLSDLKTFPISYMFQKTVGTQ
jgi:hypothetical protein